MCGVGYDMRMLKRVGVNAASNQASKVCHINMENRADFVSNGAEAREINDTRIRRTPSNDDFWSMFLGKPLNVVPTDYLRWVAHKSNCRNRLFVAAVMGELRKRSA
jgi:hypothetical protein